MLFKRGEVDAVATNDSDALTFAAGTLLILLLFQLLYTQFKKGADTMLTLITNWGNAHMATYRLLNVLSCLNLTSAQFVDFCLLCGTDFSSKVKGVGPASALKQILEYVTLEHLNAIIPDEAHEDMIDNARPIFFHNITEDMYV